MNIKEITKIEVAKMLMDKGDKIELFVRKPIFCEDWILRDISKENESLIDSMWLIKYYDNMPQLPTAYRFESTTNYTYARYNLEGNQLTEDLEFVIQN